MYRIRKKSPRRKQVWMTNLLFLMSPELFRPTPSLDVCSRNLENILGIIEESKLRWHRGSFSLMYMRIVKKSEREITITTKAGKFSFSFMIESI